MTITNNPTRWGFQSLTQQISEPSKEDVLLKKEIERIGKTNPKKASILSHKIIVWDGDPKSLKDLKHEGLKISSLNRNRSRLIGGCSKKREWSIWDCLMRKRGRGEREETEGPKKIFADIGDFNANKYDRKINTSREVEQLFDEMKTTIPIDLINIEQGEMEKLQNEYIPSHESESKLNAFFNKDESGTFLFTGPAGSGKSTLLKMIALEQWEKGSDETVCLFMHLPQGNSIDYLLKKMNITKQSFSAFVEDKDLIVLLDSYDEVYPHPTLKEENYCKKIAKEITGFKSIKFVVACRDHYLEKTVKGERNKMFSISGSSDDQIQRHNLDYLDLKKNDRLLEEFIGKKVSFDKNFSCDVVQFKNQIKQLNFEKNINTFLMLKVAVETMPDLDRDYDRYLKVDLLEKYIEKYIETEWDKFEVNKLLNSEFYREKALLENDKVEYFTELCSCLTEEMMLNQNQSCLVYDPKNVTDFWKKNFTIDPSKKELRNQPFFKLFQCLPVKVRKGISNAMEIEFQHDVIKTYFVSSLFVDYVKKEEEKEKLERILLKWIFTKEAIELIYEKISSTDYFDELKEKMKEKIEQALHGKLLSKRGKSLKNSSDIEIRRLESNCSMIQNYDPKKIAELNIRLIQSPENRKLDVFGPDEWEKYFNVKVNGALPPVEAENYLESLCPYWNKYASDGDIHVRDTHSLIFIPRTIEFESDTLSLNIKNLCEYILPEGEVVFSLSDDPDPYSDQMITKLPPNEKAFEETVASDQWVLITNDVLPETRVCTLEMQRSIIEAANEEIEEDYNMCKPIHLLILLLFHQKGKNKKLFENTYTRTQTKRDLKNEKYPGKRIYVGRDDDGRIRITEALYAYHNKDAESLVVKTGNAFLNLGMGAMIDTFNCNEKSVDP